eukprot:6181762-Pleurochrysis_carterae.AAC.2
MIDPSFALAVDDSGRTCVDMHVLIDALRGRVGDAGGDYSRQQSTRLNDPGIKCDEVHRGPLQTLISRVRLVLPIAPLMHVG